MEAFIDIVIHVLVPLIVITFIALVVILISNRVIYEILKFKIKVAKAKVDIFLTSLVFSPFDEALFSQAIDDFKKRIPFKKNWCKGLILNEIINLKQNLKGDTSSNLHFIYEAFNLDDFSLKMIKSHQWYIKSEGIYHFNALEYSKGEKYVIPYLKHHNKILSTNAYIALIALTANKLDFLIDYSEQLSLTSEIKIMDILHSRKPPMPTNLKDWIKSSNPSTVKLGIKFMVYYNYTINTDDFAKLLNSNNEAIKNEAIIATRNLFIEGAESLLINQFAYERKRNKIEILNSLAAIGTKMAMSFLSELLITETDTDLKLATVYALNAIEINYFENNFLDNQEIIKMVQHVKDPYI